MAGTFSIAIDGPAGAGKSTVARAVAGALGAVYLDTGAMYRTVGLYMRRRGLSRPEDIARAAAEPRIEARFENGAQRMYLDGQDVSVEIRTPEASMMASVVSAVPAVRARMVELQREIARGHSIVMDGRDIGTCVLPDATLKIYLTASCEVRARRRHAELAAAGKPDTYEQVFDDIVRRDYADANREIAPMRPAEDARRVDTSDMTPEQAVETIVALAREVIS